jgi:hypothetical protein
VKKIRVERFRLQVFALGDIVHDGKQQLRALFFDGRGIDFHIADFPGGEAMPELDIVPVPELHDAFTECATLCTPLQGRAIPVTVRGRIRAHTCRRRLRTPGDRRMHFRTDFRIARQCLLLSLGTATGIALGLALLLRAAALWWFQNLFQAGFPGAG